MMLPRVIGYRRLVAMAFVIGISQTGLPAVAETYLGSNVDNRAVIGFKVDEKAAQEWLPADWTLAPFPGGPFAGANLLAVFVDSHLVLGPDGKPATPSSYRGLALASLAGRDGSDEKRLFVTRVYVTDTSIDPYKNSVSASIGHSTTYDGAPGAAPTYEELWTVKPEAGGELAFSSTYEGESPSWSTNEAFVYSAVDPDFHRIYRYDQLADLVMSAPLDKKAAGELAFSTSIPEIAPMFDGSEEMIGVVAVPVYVRKLSLP